MVVEVTVVVLGALDLDGLLDTDGVLGKRTEVRGLDDGLVDTNSLLEGRADARGLDSCLVDTDGLLDHLRPVVVVVMMVAVDDSLSHTNVLPNRSRTVGAVVRANDCLVDADSLLNDGALVVVVMVVRAVNNSLGHTDVLTVAWLVSSTVFTLDLINWAQVLLRKRLVVVVWLVTVVVPVGVNFNMSVRVGRTGWSVGERKSNLGQRSSLILH